MQRFSHKAAFRKAWKLAGRPVANIISPVSAWTMPSGVFYDANHDYFIDDQRRRVPVGWVGQPYVEIEFIPADGHTDFALDIPGKTAINLIDILALWTDSIEATVRACWGVSIGPRLYTVRQWDTVPFGAQNPISVKLSLEERNAG